jgi:alpha-tubulin suppressor-like RCC1 family protein
MHPPRRSVAVLAALLGALGLACGGSDVNNLEPPPSATSIALNGGNNQTAVVGAAVPIAPSVKVTDADANPVSGVAVTFAVASGGGSITGASQITAPSGIATVGSWTLGSTVGTNTLTGTAAGLTGSPVTFTATGTVPGLSFAVISAGLSHTCGVTPAGAAYCWGFGLTGQLGDGTASESQRLKPGLVAGGPSFASVSVGADHSCGITAEGAAYCWGWNLGGELGVGTTNGPESCVLSDGFVVPCSTIPVPVAGGVSFASVSVGPNHSCGITAAGAAYCWGANGVGQLGVGTSTGPEACSDTEIAPCSTLPVRVVGGLIFASVSAGQSHTCGVTAEGDAYCWGVASRLGNGSEKPESSPVLVAGGLSFASLSAGDYHTCGITAEGAAYCWGNNQFGGLGDGTTEFRWTPVPVAGGLSFASVSAGEHYTCGLTLAGAAYCWGYGEVGQLGNGSTTYQQLMPVAVAGGLSFASVSAGVAHTCGLTNVGDLYCWGWNPDGQVGDGTNTNRLRPVRVAGG